MKKILGLMIFVGLVTVVLSLTVFAGTLHVVPNPNTTVPYSTPTVDGYVDPVVEGYSDRIDFSEETVGHFWAHNPNSTKADLYYAYDDEGLYVASVVTEGLAAIDMTGTDVTGLNQFNYSTGFDDIDLQEDTADNRYGWNGDVMGIMVDPFGVLAAEGFNGQEDRSAWYMVGLFEADVARVYKSHTSTDGEITDLIKAAGKRTAEGWCFEVMIPWDMIIADTKDCSMGCVEITNDALVKEGTYLRVGAMYHDRFYDEEQGSVATWGRYIVVPETLADGTPGPGGVGENIASYGIELVLGDPYKIYIEDVAKGAWYYDAVHYCVDKKYMNAPLVQTCCVHAFYPEKYITRADVAVILAKVFDADLDAYSTKKYYACNNPEAYYATAVAWVREKGYMIGIGNDDFGENRYITREELAVILHRIAGRPAVYGEKFLTGYIDGYRISDWSKESVKWAVDEKLMVSTDSKALKFAPKRHVTRAEMAQIIYNLK